MLTLFKRKLSAKIILGYLAPLALMLGLSLLTLTRFNSVSTSVDILVTRLAAERWFAEEIVHQILSARFYANKYVRTQSQTDLDSFRAEFAALEEMLARADHVITSPERMALLNDIKPRVEEYGDAFNQVAALIRRRQKVQSEVLDVQGLLIENKLAALRVNINQLNDPQVFLAFGNTQNGFQLMRLNVVNYLVEGNEGYIVLFEKGYQETQTALANLNAALKNPTQRKNTEDARVAVAAYALGFDTLHADYVLLKDLFRTRLDVLEPEIAEIAVEIAASVDAEFIAQNQRVHELMTQARVTLLVGTAAAALISLTLGLGFSRNLTRPLQQVMHTSQQIAHTDLHALTTQLAALAQGDVRVSLEVTAQPLTFQAEDEIGQMAAAFNEMIATLHSAGQAFGRMAIYLNAMAETATRVAHSDLEVEVVALSPDDVLGHALAGMVVNLRAADAKIQRQLHRLAALREIDAHITTGAEIAVTLEFLLGRALELLQVDAAEIILFDAPTQTLTFLARAGAAEIAPGSVPTLDSCAGLVIRQGRSLCLNRSLTDTPELLRCLDALGGDVNFYYGAPLLAQKTVRGVLQIFHRAPLAPGAEWTNFVETLAGQSAIAIANHELIRGLEERVAARTLELAERNAQLENEITERERAELALRQYAHELEASNAELDAFAHTVAHDLKAPLSIVIGFSSLLETRLTRMPTDQIGENLRRITQTGYKMQNIIDELLLLAGIRKQSDVPFSPLEMGDIVAEVQNRLKEQFEQHAATVSAPEQWPVAWGYHAWVEEIWVNYLSNALKYGGRPPHITLGWDVGSVVNGEWQRENAELGMENFELGILNAELSMPEPEIPDSPIPNSSIPNSQHIRFWVQDNGPGLTPEEQLRLFTQFTRLRHIREAEGHGLGLSIVQRIAERLNGYVGVESEVGRGSRFYFTLPCAEA